MPRTTIFERGRMCTTCSESPSRTLKCGRSTTCRDGVGRGGQGRGRGAGVGWGGVAEEARGIRCVCGGGRGVVDTPPWCGWDARQQAASSPPRSVNGQVAAWPCGSVATRQSE
eukprot:95320-Chlamydomonas_euryale.AAC.2